MIFVSKQPSYLEVLNQLAQEVGRFFKRGYHLSVDRLPFTNVSLDPYDEDVLNLIRNGSTEIFSISFLIISNKIRDPVNYISVKAIADSVERTSKNAIELLMRKIKHSVDSYSGEYEHFCNLDIFKNLCFFTPAGLYWGDWETDKGFICSSLRMSRGDRREPSDRDEWLNFKRGLENV